MQRGREVASNPGLPQKVFLQPFFFSTATKKICVKGLGLRLAEAVGKKAEK